ncbi:Ig-like domain-containing protein [Aquimarina agarilytica]|uniref:Ig-like domain-containing protein n=1 Tax=Aquimarina agarilytica TaxID=1087449 RepID=UPI00028863B8|nr:hypothetical protein [Aquimarina agarilytica]
MKVLMICLIFIPITLFGQTTNDFRSVGTGNWTNVSVWEVFNGTTWVAATTYPGQVTGTNDVSIEGGFSITINSNIPNEINSLTIGDGIGATDTFFVSGTSSLNTALITLANGGFGEWTANVTFSIPAGTAFVVIPNGSLDTSNPCSAAKILQIGTTRYASCNGNGQGNPFSFAEINANGGSLSVTPTSNTPICGGDMLSLFANRSGINSAGASLNWTGSGPAGYTFSSTLDNPVIAGLIAGDYSFTVTISSGSIFNTNTIDVIVGNAPTAPVSGGDQTLCAGGTIPTLTASVNINETIDWYDASTGGNLLLSSNTSYTPTIAGSYFAEARNLTTGCISSNRTEIQLSIGSCTIVTNRRITYRVKK